MRNWDLIVVGDKKTPNEFYKEINCIFLSLEKQKELYPEFYSKIPLNSYCRKMFGYIYAIQNKYDIIYETDDDNLFKTDLNSYLLDENKITKTITNNNGFVNVYKVYSDKYIYPRGLPLHHESISKEPEISNEKSKLDVSVIQGLVDNDPDVDAYYRININNEPFFFEKNKDLEIILDKYNISPSNTQNTFWIDPKTFHYMYLPVTVSFRYTDILRSYIALFQLWKDNKTIKFTHPTAIQERNVHDLNKDYELEKEMFDTCLRVIELLTLNKDNDLVSIYKILVSENILKQEELEIIQLWIKFTSTNLFI